jgi:hypothetical protein
MAANLAVGSVFPAWGGGFNAGFGSPALIFYPPLTSYANAVPVLVGVPVAVGVWLLAQVAHLLSGLAVYGWLRAVECDEAALPAAVVYMVAPYRFIDLYLRSALSEHWAFIWPPLILWIAVSPRLDPRLRSALTAFAVAGLLLTNLPMGVLFGLALAGWFLVSRTLRGRRAAVAAGAALGFGLAAFALIPQAFASSLLATDRFYGADAQNFRASANTLFSGGWGVWNLNTVFSLVVVLTALLAVMALVLSDRRLGDRSTRLALLSVVVLVAAASGPAGIVWDATPVLSKLQFPWRISAVLTLVLALAVGRLNTRRAWLAAALTLAAAVPFASWDRTAPAEAFVPTRPPEVAPGSAFPDPTTSWQAGSPGWYWRHHSLVEPWLIPRNQSPALLQDLAGTRAREMDLIRGRPAAVRGQPDAGVRVVRWSQLQRELEIETAAAGTVVWRVVWFPRMLVSVDGREAAAELDAETGLVSQTVPAGTHRIAWGWRPPRMLVAGRAVSVLAAVAVLALVLSVRLRTEHTMAR